jgi:hypothetical protein
MVFIIIIAHIAAAVGAALIGAALIIHGNQYHFPGVSVYAGFPPISQLKTSSFDDRNEDLIDKGKELYDLQVECLKARDKIQEGWDANDGEKFYNFENSINIFSITGGCQNYSWFNVGMGIGIGILMFILAISHILALFSGLKKYFSFACDLIFNAALYALISIGTIGAAGDYGISAGGIGLIISIIILVVGIIEKIKGDEV